MTNDQRLTIAVHVSDLQPRGGRSAGAWIDTYLRRPGPEFSIGSGLLDSDWQIGRVRDWEGTQSLNCPIDQTLQYTDDVITWRTGAACLGAYSRVRVSVVTRWNGEVDNAPAPRRFTNWVTRTTDAAAADNPGCVTRAEYQQIHGGMSQARVHQVFDTAGTPAGVEPAGTAERTDNAAPPCSGTRPRGSSWSIRP